MAKPAEVLATIADFFAFDGRGRRLDRTRRSTGTRDSAGPLRSGLAADEQERLDASCRPGRQLLGQIE